MDQLEEDNETRRQSELDFVAAAFHEEEAWCEIPKYNTSRNPSDAIAAVIYRRLLLRRDEEGDNSNKNNDNNKNNHNKVNLTLSLVLRRGYPETESLEVSLRVDPQQQPGGNSVKNSVLLKLAYNVAIPQLQLHCQAIASSLVGTEAVFSVLTSADEWIHDVWPELVVTNSQQQQQKTPNQHRGEGERGCVSSSVLGRRLIYSHHIISKTKRRDMQDLARQYDLRGFMKIGWPGLIVIEGLDDHCNAFYDDIRRWSWQYLVVRGEMQEPPTSNLEDQRRFFRCTTSTTTTGLEEVSDMSIVAEACRAAGLEALFRTSMKRYNNDTTTAEEATTTNHSNQSFPLYYGALIHVHHMNQPKAYRKWLHKTGQELGVSLWIRQFYYLDEDDGGTNQCPLIVVALVGQGGDDDDNNSNSNNNNNDGEESKARVGKFLKLWRTSYVDVDSKGHACLERRMRILVEGSLVVLDPFCSIVNAVSGSKDGKEADDWFAITSTKDELLAFVDSIGSTPWSDAIQPLLCFGSSSSSVVSSSPLSALGEKHI